MNSGFEGHRYSIFYVIIGIMYIVIGLASLFILLSLRRRTKQSAISANDINEKFFLEIEGMVNYYLKKHEGETYTAKELVNKLENLIKDNKKKEYFRNNIEKIINRMVDRGTIQLVQVSGEVKYAF